MAKGVEKGAEDEEFVAMLFFGPVGGSWTAARPSMLFHQELGLLFVERHSHRDDALRRESPGRRHELVALGSSALELRGYCTRWWKGVCVVCVLSVRTKREREKQVSRRKGGGVEERLVPAARQGVS